MSNIDREPFPRPMLIAAAALIATSISAAAIGRYVQLNAPEASARQGATALAARDLTFHDLADGSVQVRDASDDSVVFVAPPGSNGFMRGVLRSLARERRAHGIGQEPAFRLTAWSDGRLSLHDVATGREIELGAFGRDNRAAFAQLLPLAGA